MAGRERTRHSDSRLRSLGWSTEATVTSKKHVSGDPPADRAPSKRSSASSTNACLPARHSAGLALPHAAKSLRTGPDLQVWRASESRPGQAPVPGKRSRHSLGRRSLRDFPTVIQSIQPEQGMESRRGKADLRQQGVQVAETWPPVHATAVAMASTSHIDWPDLKGHG